MIVNLFIQKMWTDLVCWMETCLLCWECLKLDVIADCPKLSSGLICLPLFDSEPPMGPSRSVTLPHKHGAEQRTGVFLYTLNLHCRQLMRRRLVISRRTITPSDPYIPIISPGLEASVSNEGLSHPVYNHFMCLTSEGEHFFAALDISFSLGMMNVLLS